MCASSAWTKSCVTIGSIFIGVATSDCRIGVQDVCQSQWLHAADLLEIAKSQVTRVASTRKTVPRRHTQSSNQKNDALDACAYRASAGLSNFGFFLGIFFQVAIQAGPADAQYLCGAQAISLAHIEDSMDVRVAHLIERQRTPLISLGGARPAVLQTFRQIGDIDKISAAGDRGAGDYVFQFAHVAWPGMPQQDGLRAPGQTGNRFSIRLIVFLQKELHQQRNILETLG